MVDKTQTQKQMPKEVREVIAHVTDPLYPGMFLICPQHTIVLKFSLYTD